MNQRPPILQFGGSAVDHAEACQRKWADASQALLSTRVAVVIPLYGQSQFVTEAVSSVLSQTAPNVTAVIVNDGCPDPESHRVGRSLAAAHPERVIYLRRRNGGLSAARNTGIEYSIARFPRLDGIFMLDADNALDSAAIEVLSSRLAEEPELDWVSPHPRLFGEVNRRWHLVSRFTTFRQLHENQADAAALFRPGVFAAERYDESMRSGYEDWEFYLRLLLKGRIGATEPRAVLWYRSRIQSMLGEARSKDAAIRSYMRTKHASASLPRGRTRLEHETLPRFAIIDEFGNARFVSDPERTPVLSGETTSPPIVVLAHHHAVEQLSKLGLWRGVLFTASPAHPDEVVVLCASDEAFAIEQLPHRDERPVFGLVFSGHLAQRSFATPGLLLQMLPAARSVRVSHPDFVVSGLWSDVEIEARVAEAAKLAGADHPRTVSQPANDHLSDREFASWMHQELTRSTFPLANDTRPQVGFVMPWMKLGGVENCVLEVARAMKQLCPDVDIHLALTESGTPLTDARRTTSLFASLLSVAGLPCDRGVAMIERWGAAMDVVVNAHSGIGYDALLLRADGVPWDHHSQDLSYLHVVDQTPGGVRYGWHAVAARLEPLLDGVVVISEGLGATLRAAGVPQRKLSLGPNAPFVRPSSRHDADVLATEKAARQQSGAVLRILIAGRLDRQKGGNRSAAAIAELARRGRAVHVDVLGEPTLDVEMPAFPDGMFTFHGATSDRAKLAEYFAAADVLLLLSRWEGVPLTMLDAMAHGAVVVATDVGAVSEVAKDGINARVIACPPGAADMQIADEAVEIVEELLDDPDGALAMRRAAVDTAWSLTWNTTAGEILSYARREVKL